MKNVGIVPMIYIPALLPIPVLAPIAVMFYWLWRIRIRRVFPRVIGVSGVSTLQVNGATK